MFAGKFAPLASFFFVALKNSHTASTCTAPHHNMSSKKEKEVKKKHTDFLNYNFFQLCVPRFLKDFLLILVVVVVDVASAPVGGCGCSVVCILYSILTILM